MQNELNLEGVEKLPLKAFTEKAYLDYSMYVILDRALPHVADGLKPVQRRIVYGMSELGLSAGAKPKKAARTVGDVLGKYHPHGDQACYEAMVHMAQPFAFRYPLVDGQGNWGSQDDPKSFAAMRYTEARLTPYAKLLLAELEEGTVDWVPNYDAREHEPTLLPAQVPNVLLNGATGIAVGMSTDIPPHNMREVVSACVRLLEKPGTDLNELCEHVKGPDFATGAEIVNTPAELRQIYATGNGSVRLRARFHREDEDIVVTELPQQSSGTRVQEQIATQMAAKKLPWVADLRDESDQDNPTRLVIVPRSRRVDAEALMAHLFATTDLERTVRVNLNVIGRDGRPRVLDLRTLLKEWLSFRVDTVERRLRHRLAQVLDRLHRLDGLLVAFLNIDEVIAIIRGEDEPKPVLMERFALSEIQAEAILNLRLRHLARLEEMKLRAEQDELAGERKGLEKILGSRTRLERLVRDELLAAAEAHGDDRRSAIVERPPARALDETELVASEPVTVVLSARGWVRAGRGHEVEGESLSYKAGDEFLAAARGRSNQTAVFVDSTGRAYSLLAHTLPSARGQGEPLSGRFNLPDGAAVGGVAIGEPDARVVLAGRSGYGFVVRLGELISRNRSGKRVLTVPAGIGVLPPAPVADGGGQLVAAAGSEGHLLLFALDELPELPRGKGNKILSLPARRVKTGDEWLAALCVIGPEEDLVVHAGQRRMTIKSRDLGDYRGARGRRGSLLPRGWRKVNGLTPG